MLQAKYGNQDWTKTGMGAAKGSVWWNDLRKFCGGEEGLFENQISRRMGEGDRTFFWEDKWLGARQSLKQKYMSLFLVSTLQHRLVKEVGEWEVDQWKWNLIWRRHLFDWEKLLLEIMMQDINSTVPTKGRKDSWL